MKTGTCIKGKIVNIYDNYTSNGCDFKISHNVTAEIEYQQDSNKKIIVVDDLVIDINNLKQYINKTVSIYVYSNMIYVDIVNS